MRVLPPLNLALARRDFLCGMSALAAASVWTPALTALETKPQDDWATFRNSPQLLGVAGSSLPEKLELLWEVPAQDGVVSTPAIVDGRVYVGVLGGWILCLDLADGKVLWRYRSIDSDKEDEFAPGFTAPIAVTDELVFAGDEQGLFHVVERASGRRKWKFETGAEIVGGPMLIDDRVIFGSHDGKLYCFKQANGDKVWEFETQGPVNGTPTLAESFTFITGCDKPVLRIVDTSTGTQHDEIPLDELLIASAAVVGDVLYFGTDNGSIIALDWRTKKTLWSWSDPDRQQQIHSSPAISGDVVVIGSRDKNLHAINRQTGDELWAFSTRAKIDGSPVIVGDRVFVGSADKFLYAVALADGKESWKYPAGQAISGSAAVGEGRLVIGTETSNGRILCFGAK